MRPLPLVATGLLAAALLTSPSAYAATETCQGRPATVVGSLGDLQLVGTEGDDVVVTNGATGARTLGGNDLVCVTGGPENVVQVVVETAAGDDVVDASGSTTGVFAVLGAGADTYTGSEQRDSVQGGDSSSSLYVDTERDIISTGTGGDDVLSGTSSGVANGDVVVLEGGGDVTWRGPMTADGRLEGGASNSRLSFSPDGRRVIANAARGTLVEDGARTLTWTGFDRYTVATADGGSPRSLTFSGSGRDEELELVAGGRHHVDMAGGDDRLLIRFAEAVGGSRSSYAGGAGQDSFALWAGRFLDLDLASGRMITKDGGRARSTLTRFEQPYVVARRLTLAGTKRADDLRFQACTATVHGRGGPDIIAQNIFGTTFPSRLRCQRRGLRLFGDGGNDVVRGSAGPDVLFGGPGRDIVSGNGGRDRCSGEKLRSCEVRLR